MTDALIFLLGALWALALVAWGQEVGPRLHQDFPRLDSLLQRLGRLVP